MSENLSSFDTTEDLHHALKDTGLFSDLLQQAEFGFDHHVYADAVPGQPGALNFAAAPSLSPLEVHEKCGSPVCRADYTDTFIHSLGLYADRVLIVDSFTSLLIGHHRLSPALVDALHIELKQIDRLLPLIEQGVVGLASPRQPICSECHAAARRTTGRAIRSLYEALEGEIEFLGGGTTRHPVLALSAPFLSSDEDHPLIRSIKLRPADLRRYGQDLRKLQRERIVTPALFDFGKQRLLRDLEGTANQVSFALSMAQFSRSALMAGSRLETMCLAQVDGRRPSMEDLDSWETVRSIQLPWIREMDANEILALRDEASSALPRLRARLATRLGEETGDKDHRAVVVARELQEQAEEVESELRAISSRRETRRQLSVGGLAFTVVLYGLASGTAPVTAAGLGGMIAALGHLHGREMVQDDRRERLQAEPAYVLLKARQIVSRRHEV